jgi:diguanylate cyclase (GGDEF)-like protein/PAS domain S-box-containing protein
MNRSIRTYSVGPPTSAAAGPDCAPRAKRAHQDALPEAECRQLIDGMNDTVLVLDFSGKFVDVNRRAVETLGYSRIELLDMGPADIDPDRSKEGIAELIARNRRGEDQLFETRHRAKDGRIIPVEVSASLVSYGGTPAILSVSRDITDRKRDELALEKEISRRRILVDQSTDGIVVLDVLGNVREANQQYARMLGYSMEEVYALHVWDWDAMHSKEELLQILQAVDDSGDHFETKHRCKDGTVIDVEISTNAPIIGGEKHIFCICRDVTERKRAGAALERSRQRMRLHVEQTPLAVIEFDLDRRVVEWNPAAERVFGYRRDEALGQPWTFVVPEATRTQVDGVWDSLVAQTGGLRSTNENVTKDGRIILCEWYNTPLVGADGTCIGVASLMMDVTERKRAEEELRRSERRYRSLIENAHDLIFTLDAQGRFIDLNPAVCRVTGYRREELMGRALSEIAIWVTREDSGHPEPDTREISLLSKDGRAITLEAKAQSVPSGSGGTADQYIARDVTGNRLWEEALAFQARHDAATSLPNRHELCERLLALTLAADRRPFGLYILDLDNFKDINDTHGHETGDFVLREVASRLKTGVPDAHTVARLGGDEFALIVPLPNQDDSRRVGLQILGLFSGPILVENEPLAVCASVGGARFPGDIGSMDGLLRLADLAMYEAKRKGGARYCAYGSDGVSASLRWQPLKAEVGRALARGDFTLYYQPQVDLRLGAITRLEALARWNHPQRGLLVPAQFMALIDEQGLADQLLEWVLRRALSEVAAWRKEGQEVSTSVNLSARSLDHPNLPALVEALLCERSADPSWLILELTEQSIIRDPQKAVSVLSTLRSLGVGIAIDDFGAGQAAFTYLKALPADEVKIDKSFVTNMAIDKHDAAIVRSIVSLAQDLGLRTVAEGVESEATLNLLTAYGCDFAQGFFLGRPMPPRSAAFHLSRVYRGPGAATVPKKVPAGRGRRALSAALLRRSP